MLSVLFSCLVIGSYSFFDPTDLICDYVDFVPKPAEGCNGEGEQVKSEGEIRSALAIPGEPINDGELPF